MADAQRLGMAAADENLPRLEGKEETVVMGINGRHQVPFPVPVVFCRSSRDKTGGVAAHDRWLSIDDKQRMVGAGYVQIRKPNRLYLHDGAPGQRGVWYLRSHTSKQGRQNKRQHRARNCNDVKLMVLRRLGKSLCYTLSRLRHPYRISTISDGVTTNGVRGKCLLFPVTRNASSLLILTSQNTISSESGNSQST